MTRLNFTFGKNIIEVKCPSQGIILGATCCQYVLLLVIIIGLILLIKVVHDRFVYSKVTIFSNVINTNLGEDTLRQGKYAFFW